MLFNEPKLLKSGTPGAGARVLGVSVLFNEPKLLKCRSHTEYGETFSGFSALQRAEIAEIAKVVIRRITSESFSALQRAEIAEIVETDWRAAGADRVSVLFNEPKLLKSC